MEFLKINIKSRNNFTYEGHLITANPTYLLCTDTLKLKRISISKSFFKNHYVTINGKKIKSFDNLNLLFTHIKSFCLKNENKVEDKIDTKQLNTNVLPGFVRASSSSGSICSSGSSESIASLRSIYSDIERRSLNQSEYIKDLVDLEVKRAMIDIRTEFISYKEEINKNLSEFKSKNDSNLLINEFKLNKSLERLNGEIKILQNDVEHLKLPRYEKRDVRPEILQIHEPSSKVESNSPKPQSLTPKTTKIIVGKKSPLKNSWQERGNSSTGVRKGIVEYDIQNGSPEECIDFVIKNRHHTDFAIIDFYLNRYPGAKDRLKEVFIKVEQGVDHDEILHDVFYVLYHLKFGED